MSNAQKKDSKKENKFSCCEDFKKMCGKMEDCCSEGSEKFDCKTMMEKYCGDASGKFDCKTMMEKMCNC